MVGVPGKYKGCETCRRRRVKCDNTRPLCKKCVDNGRECEGYERQMVFITATLEDGGRCSSHPPRQIGGSSKKGKSQSPVPPEEASPQFVAENPLQPSWNHMITMSRGGASQGFRIVAVNTRLRSIMQDHSGREDFSLEVPPYEMPDFPFYGADGELDVMGRCIVHLAPEQERSHGPGNLCMYLYEHNSTSTSSGSGSMWPSGPDRLSSIRKRGPQAFRSFPDHHFFSRIYRPCALSVALMKREETFLASPEWMNIPWEQHEKTRLDRLFDIISHIPSVLARTEMALSEPVTQVRQHRVQELLANCLHIEHQLDEWYNAASMINNVPSWWEEQDIELQIPFLSRFNFIDDISSIMFIYYWMALLRFHRCIESLRASLYHLSYQNMYGQGIAPPNQALDEYKYQQGRELAGKICRSLDFALRGTLQPDLLVAPWSVARDYYREISDTTGDGMLELFWCDSFREKLVEKGQCLAQLVQGKKWTEVDKL